MRRIGFGCCHLLGEDAHNNSNFQHTNLASTRIENSKMENNVVAASHVELETHLMQSSVLLYGKDVKDGKCDGSMKFVCYFAIPRDDSSHNTRKQLRVANLDPFLCTHIIVAFAKIENNELLPYAVEDLKVYQEVVALKRVNPNLKVLLSVGGGETDGGFPALVRDHQAIERFSVQAANFLKQYGFDGLDLDWEFPAWPRMTRSVRERSLFTQLVHNLYYSLQMISFPPLLLTLAVAGPKAIIDRSYEVAQLAEYVSFVMIMGYDYHMFWPYLPFTGHNSPLKRHSKELGYFATMNIEWSVNYWMQNGMPKEKLVVGIPTYGLTWKLLSSFWHGVGAPSIGRGMQGGSISYPEACKFLGEGATRYFDEESLVPFAAHRRNWISYEDSSSVTVKAQWIHDSGLAGVMTWNLNSDDWEGIYSQRKFELHNAIKQVIGC